MELDLTSKILCAKCGGANKKGTKFCIFCGDKLINYDPGLEGICPNCKKVINKKETFCKFCGIKIDEYKAGITEFSELVLPRSINTSLICGIFVVFIIFFTLLYMPFLYTVFGSPLLYFLLIIMALAFVRYVYKRLKAKKIKNQNQPSSLFMSNEFIRINIPNKGDWQLKWSDIASCSIVKNGLIYQLKFISRLYIPIIIKLQEHKDFNSCMRIITLIQQYANKLNIPVTYPDTYKKKKERGGGGFALDGLGDCCNCSCAILILLSISISIGWSLFDPHIPNEKLKLTNYLLMVLIIVFLLNLFMLLIKNRSLSVKYYNEFKKNTIIINTSKK